MPRDSSGQTAAVSCKLDEWHVALFAQDDWKPLENLTLNLGVRYQYESSVPDKNNIAPRIGFAWDPTSNGRMVFRGGFGIFHSDVFSTVDAFEAYQDANGFRSVTSCPWRRAVSAVSEQTAGPGPSAGCDLGARGCVHGGRGIRARSATASRVV